MTLRQVYEGVLVELNKVLAPSMLLEDFNYFANKSLNQYINKKYNVYDVNQQSTDDLRVLKATARLTVSKTTKYGSNTTGNVTSLPALYGATYEAILPSDYLHLLNCICNYHVKKQFKCYDPGTYVQFGAIRLTADLWGLIINNFYMKPSYKKPYYYLHNVNSNTDVPTNPYNSTTGQGTDMVGEQYRVTPGAGTNSVSANTTGLVGLSAGVNDHINLPRNQQFTDTSNYASLIEKPAGQRFANSSQVRIEIRTGKDDSIFELEEIYVDYIKAPQYLRLTQEQIDLTEDTSQIMEFPDYVCQEIINELTHIIMENSSDPRLQSHMPTSMSIANPAQAPTLE